MHKEVDFIAEYNEEMMELLAEPRRPQANGSGSGFGCPWNWSMPRNPNIPG